MNVKNLDIKQKINEAAIELYMKDEYSISNLSKQAGMSSTEIYLLFPNKISALRFYYPALIYRYRAMLDEN